MSVPYLDELRRQGHIEDIDRHFGALIAELDGRDGAEVPLAAALASSSARSGNPCLALSEVVAGRVVAGAGRPAAARDRAVARSACDEPGGRAARRGGAASPRPRRARPALPRAGSGPRSARPRPGSSGSRPPPNARRTASTPPSTGSCHHPNRRTVGRARRRARRSVTASASCREGPAPERPRRSPRSSRFSSASGSPPPAGSRSPPLPGRRRPASRSRCARGVSGSSRWCRSSKRFRPRRARCTGSSSGPRAVRSRWTPSSSTRHRCWTSPSRRGCSPPFRTGPGWCSSGTHRSSPPCSRARCSRTSAGRARARVARSRPA